MAKEGGGEVDTDDGPAEGAAYRGCMDAGAAAEVQAGPRPGPSASTRAAVVRAVCSAAGPVR